MENILVNKRSLSSRDWLVDVLVALAALLFAYVQLYLATSPIVFHDDTFRDMVGILTRAPDPSAYVLLAFTALPLVFRRMFPWPVYVFVIVLYSFAQDSAPGYAFSIIGPVIALFTLANERPRVEVIVAAALAAFLLCVATIPSDNDSVALVVRVQNLSYMALAVAAGVAWRAYQHSVRETEQRALEAERTRETEAARRVEEERVRIAREIHDITAHSLSAVGIQAAAAEKLIDRNPEAAREAIVQVRMTSKSALEEIRSMIGVLRNEDAEAEMRPTNGTDRMPDLCEYARKAGLEVHYEAGSYQRHNAPAFVDVALFGIAREAVTNTVRHAQAKNLWVRLAMSDGYAMLTVEDDGIGLSSKVATEHSPLSGHGVQGMEERVRVLHGTFQAGDRAAGGYRVQVSLPLGERE